jgi:transcription antitermination factor NusG
MNEMDLMNPSPPPHHWFALQTRSRYEKVVQGQLEKKNVEHFLPMIGKISQWTDRKKEIRVPLFAGYCFARFALADRLPVLQSQGVVRVVGHAGCPEPIPDDEIESLRKLIIHSSNFVCHPYLREGMLVKVISGPLQGVNGRFIREARQSRLVVSISLIQRAVAVEIDADCLAPAPNNLAIKNFSSSEKYGAPMSFCNDREDSFHGTHF